MVRFSDVAALTDMFPLFLIVTDVARADIIVVSSIDQDSRDIEIAAAARASGGFPGFFQPVRLSDDHEICVDGGVISNFPAWVFGQDYRDKLRASGLRLPVAFAGLPWLHVGLRLPVDAAPSPHSFQGFLSCLVGLLTGRARARLDDKLASIPVKRRWVTATPPPAAEAPSNVLDFSALSRQELIGHAFDRGRRDGQLAIDPDLFRWPADAEIKPFLATLAERASALLGPWLVAGSLVRVNIFLPEGGDLVLAYHANMDGDPDENIRLSHGQGITSLVYSQRLTSIADITPRQQDSMSPTQEDDPYLRGPGAPAIRGDRTWLISVPLIDLTEMSPARTANAPLVLDVDGPVLGVLNVDAAIDYQASGAPLPNVGAANHWAVLALFDTMKSTIFQCGMVLNQRFLQPPKSP